MKKAKNRGLCWITKHVLTSHEVDLSHCIFSCYGGSTVHTIYHPAKIMIFRGAGWLRKPEKIIIFGHAGKCVIIRNEIIQFSRNSWCKQVRPQSTGGVSIAGNRVLPRIPPSQSKLMLEQQREDAERKCGFSWQLYKICVQFAKCKSGLCSWTSSMLPKKNASYEVYCCAREQSLQLDFVCFSTVAELCLLPCCHTASAELLQVSCTSNCTWQILSFRANRGWLPRITWETEK